MRKNILFVCALLFISKIAHSKEVDNGQYIEVGALEASLTFGYGGIENPIHGAEDIVSFVLPHLAYYGENWYFDDFSLGYSVYQNRSVYFDVVGTFNEDGFFFELDGIDKLFAINGLRDLNRPGRPPVIPDYLTPIERSISYQSGFAFGYANRGVGIELTTLHDISSVHNGSENKLVVYYANTLFGGQFLGEAGATHKSNELIEYYYRIRPSESVSRIVNSSLGGSAINYHLKLEYRYPINEHFSFMLRISNTWIDKDLSNTPMFGADQYLSGFSGITFEF